MDASKLHNPQVAPAVCVGALFLVSREDLREIGAKGEVLTAIHEISHTLYYNNDGATTGKASGNELPTNDEVGSMLGVMRENNRIIEKE